MPEILCLECIHQRKSQELNPTEGRKLISMCIEIGIQQLLAHESNYYSSLSILHVQTRINSPTKTTILVQVRYQNRTPDWQILSADTVTDSETTI